MQEVNKNINQSSIASKEISDDIAVVSQSSGDIANSSDQMKVSVTDLRGLAAKLNSIVNSFKI